MAVDYNNLLRTGVYTVYDNLSLAETTVVANMSQHPGVRAVFQWNITGNSPLISEEMVKVRVLNVRDGKWTDWKVIEHAPSPPQPDPQNPGQNPGDGLWDLYNFTPVNYPGIGSRYTAHRKTTGLPLVKTYYSVPEDSQGRHNVPSPPYSTVYLLMDPSDLKYKWTIVVEDASSHRITLQQVKNYTNGDFAQENIVEVTAPDTTPVMATGCEWRQIIEGMPEFTLPGIHAWGTVPSPLGHRFVPGDYVFVDWNNGRIFYDYQKNHKYDPTNDRNVLQLLQDSSIAVTVPVITT